MLNDLFVNLEKYRANGERAQTENFLKELVAYLLREEIAARNEFVRLAAKEQADRCLHGRVKVSTQCFTESHNPGLNGLRLDLVLTCDDSELIVENKVDSQLIRQQLQNYIDYAGESGYRHVAVVSKERQRIIDGFLNEDRFLGETLW